MSRAIMAVMAALALGGCVAPRGHSEQEPPFRVRYETRNALHGTATVIVLDSGRVEIRQTVQGREMRAAGPLLAGDLDSLRSLFRSSRLAEIQLPEPQKLLDAPEEIIAVSDTGGTVTLDLTRRQPIPAVVDEFRSRLLRLAGMRNEAAKTALGL